MMVWRYAVAWLGLVVLGILNGVIRNAVYSERVGELRAHQASTIILIIVIALYTWVLSGWWKIESGAQAVTIGLIWLVLTVAFEFGFGHYVAGHPWTRLLHDYNILQGRIWAFVLIWNAIVPYVMYRLRG
jgi:hypothetical protein